MVLIDYFLLPIAWLIICIPCSHLGPVLHVRHVDVAGAVSSRIPDLMSQDRTARLGPEVDTEVVVELHTTILGVHVNHQHHRAFLERAEITDDRW